MMGGRGDCERVEIYLIFAAIQLKPVLAGASCLLA